MGAGGSKSCVIDERGCDGRVPVHLHVPGKGQHRSLCFFPGLIRVGASLGHLDPVHCNDVMDRAVA